MARAIILTFKDNDAAEAVVAKLDAFQAADSITGLEYGDLGVILAAYAKPEALLARPTQGCKCRRTGRIQGWTRTKRFGWFVCPECKKPSQMVVNRWITNLIGTVGSNNLLQELRDKVAEDQESPDDRAIRIADARTPEETAALREEMEDLRDRFYAEKVEDAKSAVDIHPDFIVKGTITGRLPAPEGSVHEPPLQG